MLSYCELPEEEPTPIYTNKITLRRETNIDVIHLLLIFMIAMFFLTI